MRVCGGGGGGIVLCNLLVAIPGLWAMALPFAQCWTDGLAPHSDTCSSRDVLNLSAYENQSHKKSHKFHKSFVSRDFFTLSSEQQ